MGNESLPLQYGPPCALVMSYRFARDVTAVAFAAYDWSVGFAGGPNTFLIYDATDEIALPYKLHKQPIAFERGFGDVCAGKVTHLLDHYYVCTF
jgi:hypothetical protein